MEADLEELFKGEEVEAVQDIHADGHGGRGADKALFVGVVEQAIGFEYGLVAECGVCAGGESGDG